MNEYVALYSSWENHQGYMLTSHRNYISVYELSDANSEPVERWRHLRVTNQEMISQLFFERITPSKRENTGD